MMQVVAGASECALKNRGRLFGETYARVRSAPTARAANCGSKSSFDTVDSKG
jgi:hypothetical protein